MKSIFFLPAAALAGGLVGKNYGQDYTITDKGNGFECDIDGNADYNFQVDTGYIREVKVQDKPSCEWKADDSKLVISDGGKSAKVEMASTCFTAPPVDNPNTDEDESAVGHTGIVEIYISADPNSDLFLGKVWQNMKCTMKRDHSVTYNFLQIMLDTEQEGALADGGENGYLLSRRTSNGQNMTSDTNNVTSGETLYFQIESVGDYTDFDFDVMACSVNKGNDTYYLADLGKDHVDYCVDEFLATSFKKDRKGGKWTFTYEAFTFKTENQSQVSLTCDIEACQKDESETSGWCPNMDAACAGNAKLTKVPDVFCGAYDNGAYYSSRLNNTYGIPTDAQCENIWLAPHTNQYEGQPGWGYTCATVTNSNWFDSPICRHYCCTIGEFP